MKIDNNHREGLVYQRVSDTHSAVIDPGNVFWAIHKNNAGKYSVIPREALSLYNRVKNKLDAEMEDFRFSAQLTAVYIDPTDRCNSHCPYCYVPADIRKNGTQMTKEQLFKSLDKILEYFSATGSKKKPVIIFHASEPLLAKDIVFAAIKEYSHKFKFGLQTNATLLTEHDVAFLKAERVGVGISLDAATAVINNRTRPTTKGKGNFEQAVKAIEWFDGYPGLNVISTMTKFNITGLSTLVKFLHRKKVPCVLFNPMRLTQKYSLSVKPDESQMTTNFLKAVDTAIRLTRESDHEIIVANFTNIILSIIAPEARRMMCDISPCGGGRCFLTVTASGEMVPCGEFIALKGFSGGNILNGAGIKEAMVSKPFQQIRSRFVEKIDECNSCSYRNICGAPCPAELEARGGMYQKAVFCEFYKATIDHAFRLIAEGKEKYCLRKDSLGELNYQYQL